MRARSVSALVLLAAACGKTAATPYDGPATLTFSVYHFEGSYSFTVYDDGRAEYVSTDEHHLDRSSSRPTSAKPEEIHAVMKVLKENDFCSLRSSNRPGIPDEARPKIEVSSHGMRCSVQMWDGEFRDNPRAHACLEAVEGLGHALGQRARNQL